MALRVKEFFKAMCMLRERKIYHSIYEVIDSNRPKGDRTTYVSADVFDEEGFQIGVIRIGKNTWGHEDGLLEYYGYKDRDLPPLGPCTAEEVIKYIEEDGI